jgi:hypothetical protein
MPNLAPHAALATDDGFRRRLQAALVQKATAAANAAKPTDQAQVQGWQERRDLAADVLRAPEQYVTRYAWPVAGAAAVLQALNTAGGNVTQIPDATIETALDAALASLLAAQRADTT